MDGCVLGTKYDWFDEGTWQAALLALSLPCGCSSTTPVIEGALALAQETVHEWAARVQSRQPVLRNSKSEMPFPASKREALQCTCHASRWIDCDERWKETSLLTSYSRPQMVIIALN
jgi:hypothetical protein